MCFLFFWSDSFDVNSLPSTLWLFSALGNLISGVMWRAKRAHFKIILQKICLVMQCYLHNKAYDWLEVGLDSSADRFDAAWPVHLAAVFFPVVSARPMAFGWKTELQLKARLAAEAAFGWLLWVSQLWSPDHSRPTSKALGSTAVQTAAAATGCISWATCPDRC